MALGSSIEPLPPPFIIVISMRSPDSLIANNSAASISDAFTSGGLLLIGARWDRRRCGHEEVAELKDLRDSVVLEATLHEFVEP